MRNSAFAWLAPAALFCGLAFALPAPAQSADEPPLPPARPAQAMASSMPSAAPAKLESASAADPHVAAQHPRRARHRLALRRSRARHYAERWRFHDPWGAQLAEESCNSLACPGFIILGVGY